MGLFVWSFVHVVCGVFCLSLVVLVFVLFCCLLWCVLWWKCFGCEFCLFDLGLV